VGLGAPLTHYKVCSTFDSAPEVGSIGHVADMARGARSHQTISVLAGAPPLRRYTVFGNHFAAAERSSASTGTRPCRAIR
jgi:uncharacterized protein YgbK (DUF1537 family)